MNHQTQRQPSFASRPFFAGFGFRKVFLFFVLGCVIGTYFEQFTTLLRTGEWVSRAGLLYGPFNPVYGFGVAAFIALLGNQEPQRPFWKTWLYSALIGGAVEWVASFVQEWLFQTSSWNYDTLFLNLGGRTTLPFMIGWGLGGAFLLKVIYPWISQCAERLPQLLAKVLYYSLLLFLVWNMVWSLVVMMRVSQRWQAVAPANGFEAWIDVTYPDSVIQEIYPNLKFNHAPITK
ncbi:MAG: putative ABC transporter permease [Erysipelotrichaceae bacterium]